tara:strand:+ start:4294 stop:5109 length:816 start_codon:yes stop_codon:yes gene_type:complete
MSDRTVIWFRDAFVIVLVIYVVSSVAMAPWGNLKPNISYSDSCEPGCPPVMVFPENGYYHYKDELTFDWNPISIDYLIVLEDDDNGGIVLSANVTDKTSFTTSKIVAGNYTSSVFFKGISGSFTSDDYPLIYSEEHNLESSSKITLLWAETGVTYNIQIKLVEDPDILPDYHPVVHEVSGLESTSYEYSDFTPGHTYFWSVSGSANFTDNVGNRFGFESEMSTEFELNIDTTKFLAFELFNDWDLPFILLGVLMVIALQAGVFLAREEKDD